MISPTEETTPRARLLDYYLILLGWAASSA